METAALATTNDGDGSRGNRGAVGGGGGGGGGGGDGGGLLVQGHSLTRWTGDFELVPGPLESGACFGDSLHSSFTRIDQSKGFSVEHRVQNNPNTKRFRAYHSLSKTRLTRTNDSKQGKQNIWYKLFLFVLFVVVCSVCLLLTLAFRLTVSLSAYFGCISTLYCIVFIIILCFSTAAAGLLQQTNSSYGGD